MTKAQQISVIQSLNIIYEVANKFKNPTSKKIVRGNSVLAESIKVHVESILGIMESQENAPTVATSEFGSVERLDRDDTGRTV